MLSFLLALVCSWKRVTDCWQRLKNRVRRLRSDDDGEGLVFSDNLYEGSVFSDYR